MWLLLVNDRPVMGFETSDLAKEYARRLYDDEYATLAVKYVRQLEWVDGCAYAAMFRGPDITFALREIPFHHAQFVLLAKYISSDAEGFRYLRTEIIKCATTLEELEQAAIQFHMRWYSGRGKNWYPDFIFDELTEDRIHKVYDDDGGNFVTYQIKYVGGCNE